MLSRQGRKMAPVERVEDRAPRASGPAGIQGQGFNQLINVNDSISYSTKAEAAAAFVPPVCNTVPEDNNQKQSLKERTQVEKKRMCRRWLKWRAVAQRPLPTGPRKHGQEHL